MNATHLGFYNTSGSRTHVRFQFSTLASAGGNIAPSSAFEAADIRIYKAADSAAFSATQRSSANGITMTSPFDSLTGFHDVDIDLTDNTDAGFYATGGFYSIVLAPDETVDSQTITAVVLAYFEINVQAVNAIQISGDATAADNLEALLDGTGGVTLVASAFTLTTPITANATQISGDATAADNAEAFFDGTGYAGTNNVIPTVTTVTNAVTANVTQWLGSAVATPTVAGVPEVDMTHAVGNALPAGVLPNAVAGNAGGLFIAGANAATTVNITGNITGNLTGSVGSVTGNVGGNVVGSVGSVVGLTTVTIAVAVLTTAITEAYRANGAAPTLAEALSEILSHLGEAEVTGTTKTIKKFDHVTTAETFDLDSATDPTSITRAT